MTGLGGFLIILMQEDGKAEENMAQKRAALLEKRMRREKESLQKKMQLEAELEQKKEEARYGRNTVKWCIYGKNTPLQINSSMQADFIQLFIAIEYMWVGVRCSGDTVFYCHRPIIASR